MVVEARCGISHSNVFSNKKFIRSYCVGEIRSTNDTNEHYEGAVQRRHAGSKVTLADLRSKSEDR